jgi:hypothetical protein
MGFWQRLRDSTTLTLGRRADVKKVLLIDDQRILNAHKTARTFEDGMKALDEGPWDLLLLDHDLGDKDPRHTGHGILQHLEEYPEKRPREVRLVTANPVGKAAMEEDLLAMGYKMEPLSQIWYRSQA